jgi:hypothetical protein
MAPNGKVIALFDVDGTLTVPRQARLRARTQRSSVRCACVQRSSSATLCVESGKGATRTLVADADCALLARCRGADGGPGDAGLPAGAAQGTRRAAFACSCCVAVRALTRTRARSALTRPRRRADRAQTCAVGIVGGSDLVKICEQLGADGARFSRERTFPSLAHTRSRAAALPPSRASSAAIVRLRVRGERAGRFQGRREARRGGASTLARVSHTLSLAQLTRPAPRPPARRA